jgi:hypothetical protein
MDSTDEYSRNAARIIQYPQEFLAVWHYHDHSRVRLFGMWVIFTTQLECLTAII